MSFTDQGSQTGGNAGQGSLWDLISSLFSQGGNLFGGGQSGNNDSLFNWGVSPFDWSTIMGAGQENLASMANRYNQLGLGGSTMEKEDLGQLPTQTGGIPGQTEGLIGELQTQNANNPALNPALQPQQQDPNVAANQTSTAQGLGTLAGLAGSFL